MSIRLSARGVIIRDEQILLVEYVDENGLHYNIPGGGVEQDEALHDAVRREVREETGLIVTVGRLLLIYEYVPSQQQYRYGPQHTVALMFECMPVDDTEPDLKRSYDPNQTGLRWVPLTDLADVTLFPKIALRLVTALNTPYPPLISDEVD